MHGGLTPKEELIQILEDFQPNQVLLEFTEKEFENINKTALIVRDEMGNALEWALSKRIAADYFDVDMPLSEKEKSFTDPVFVAMNEEFGKELSKYSWKELNEKKEFDSKLNELEKELHTFISKEASDEREKLMKQGVSEKMLSEGIVVILTGVDHLDFFEKEFPNALFPLRYPEDS